MVLVLISTLAGIVGGICSSTSLGPINLHAMDLTYRGDHKGRREFLAGVILTDLIFATIAILGAVAIGDLSSIERPLTLLGGGLMITLGAYQGWLLWRPESPEGTSRRLPGSQFFTGVILCGSNPAFLIFWLYVMSLIKILTGDAPDLVAGAFFLCGVAAGDSLWFAFIVRMTRHGLKLASERLVFRIRLAICIFFVGLGTWSIAR